MMIFLRRTRKRILGFTLSEVSIVVVILGLLLAVALPKYFNQRKRVCNQEAVAILKHLYDAQTDYKRDKAVFTNNLANLPISFDGQSSCFGSYSVSTGSAVTCSGSHNSIASIPAADSSYTLHISDVGRIVCLPCGSSLCTSFGY